MKWKTKSSGRRSRYGVLERKRIAQEYLSSDCSYEDLGRKYGLDRTSIRNYVKEFRDSLGIKSDLGKMSKSEQEEKDALQKRIKELEQQLADARLKAEALDVMIDIAEDMFEVDIRKKYGSQQQKK